MSSLENIYISPLELCNLSCKYCYTQKPKTILSNHQILGFVNQYQQALKDPQNNFLRALRGETSPLGGNVGNPHSPRTKNSFKDLSLKSIIFCGGEVFTLKDFPELINKLQSLGIFVSVITNGTIDVLDQINEPHNCQLIVSFDGPKDIHDTNRGKGNFQKSLDFVRHALDIGFPVEIFYLITKDSYPYRDKLDIFGLHKTYLVDRLGSLTPIQTKNIRQNYPCYPPKNFGCNMISLQSNGKIYGCCESNLSIGSIDDDINQVIQKYLELTTASPSCYDPKFKCNL